MKYVIEKIENMRVCGFTYEEDATEGNGEFTPIEEGEYTVIVDKAEDTAYNNVNQISLQLRITSEKAKNRIIFANLKENNPKLKMFLGIMVKAFNIDAKNGDEITAASFMGKQCKVETVNNEYNDKIYTNVKKWIPLDNISKTTKEKEVNECPF